MHELSIAYNIVEVVEEALQTQPPCEVSVVYLRLGVLAGVVKEALLFGFEVAKENTLLANATLMVEEVPVLAFCPTCQTEVRLSQLQYLRCPHCDTPTPDIRQGKELEVINIEVLDDETAYIGN